jgi:FkbM family methyltransferase
MELKDLMEEKGLGNFNYEGFVNILSNTTEFLIESNPNHDIIFCINNTRFLIDKGEEILILSEIFAKGEYEFLWDKPCVIIDIGMNVGIASLFFAAKSNVSKVYSFEPFYETYQKAQINIGLNPVLKKKIETFNYGLGKEAHIQTCSFNEECRGVNTTCMGEISVTQVRVKNEHDLSVEVHIEQASDKIGIIADAHPYQELILKVDCEGAEYDIFEDLFESGVLAKVKGIIMEFHGGGELERLTDILKLYGFFIFQAYSDFGKPRTGMIYAVKP